MSENYLPEIERFSEHIEGAAHRRNYREMPWDKDPFWGGEEPGPFKGLGGKHGFDPAVCRAVAQAAIQAGQIRVTLPPKSTPQKKTTAMKKSPKGRLCKTCCAAKAEEGTYRCVECSKVSAERKLAREEKAATQGLDRSQYINLSNRIKIKPRRTKHEFV